MNAKQNMDEKLIPREVYLAENCKPLLFFTVVAHVGYLDDLLSPVLKTFVGRFLVGVSESLDVNACFH